MGIAKAEMKRVSLYIEKGISMFLRPVSNNLLSFIFFTCFLSVVPILKMIVFHERIFRFLNYTVCESLVISYLLCLLLCFVKNGKVRNTLNAIFWIICGFWFLVETFCLIMTGSGIDTNSAMLILETNKSEMQGFVKQYLTWKVFFVLICEGIFGALMYFIIKKVSVVRINKTIRNIVGGILIVLMLFGISKIYSLRGMIYAGNYEKLLQWIGQGSENADLVNSIRMNNEPMPQKLIYLFKYIKYENGNLKSYLDLQQKVLTSDKVSSDSVPDFNICIIIGESFIRKHSSLYGYYLPTNPRLGREREKGNLIVFDDVISTANMTTLSVRNMMNLNSISNGEKWYESVYFPLLMKKAGWKILYYDNQVVDITRDTGISMMFYSDLNREHVYDDVSDTLFRYDGDYVNYVSGKLRSQYTTRNGKLAIYHLMGQHFAAKDRFDIMPRFTVSDIDPKYSTLKKEQLQEIADYDNATFYNDSVVGKILDDWKSRPSIILYFSDHGEDIWDLGEIGARNVHRPNDPAWLDRQYHIPFMVWMSDSFIANHKELYDRIKKSAERSGTLDDIGHLILGLGKIESCRYDPQRDLFNEDYKPIKRKTVEGYSF